MAGRKSDRGDTGAPRCPLQQARLQAYEPPKDAQRWMAAAGARARAHMTKQKSDQMCKPSASASPSDRQQQLVAQLKAAEARARVRNLRLSYEGIRAGYV